MHLDDGFPDPRLSALKEHTRAYHNQAHEHKFYTHFGSYNSPVGSLLFRKNLSDYLNFTRGLKTTEQNIMTVKGTVIGLNLVCNSYS